MITPSVQSESDRVVSENDVREGQKLLLTRREIVTPDFVTNVQFSRDRHKLNLMTVYGIVRLTKMSKRRLTLIKSRDKIELIKIEFIDLYIL